MSTQYDAIGSKYKVLKSIPLAATEAFHVHTSVAPYLQKSHPIHVLDLACGTGHYSEKIIDWGADDVLGVDISPIMIDIANNSIKSEHTEKLKFMVADTRSLGQVNRKGHELGENSEEHGEFDIVLGIWCLNYAESLEEMSKVWKTVATNLKKGGVFIGVTAPPVEDLDTYVSMASSFEKKHPAFFGLSCEFPKRLDNEQGYRCKVTYQGEDGFEFNNYHLRKSVYEQAARQGGMAGRLEWKTIFIPEDIKKTLSVDFLEKFHQYGPYFGVIVAEKYLRIFLLVEGGINL